MKLYHRTSAAARILECGFKDSVGRYLTSELHSGVWFSDRPLDINEEAHGGALLSISIPERVIKRYEWSEDRKPYREFLIPAAVVNRYGPAKVESDD
jgi:hypothetical protein